MEANIFIYLLSYISSPSARKEDSLNEPGLVGVVDWKAQQSRELGLVGDGGFPCPFPGLPFPSQLLTLQLLGRSAVPDTPDSYRLLPGHALQRREPERCRGLAGEQACVLGTLLGAQDVQEGSLSS